MRDDEQALLGALMLDGRQVLELDLSADDFSTAKGQTVFRAMSRLATNGVAIEPTTLAEECEDRDVVMDLAVAGGAPQNAKHYAKSIRKAAKLRRITQAATATLNAAQQKDADPESLADELMTQLSTASGSSATWEMPELIAAAVAEIEHAKAANDSGQAVGIPTGWRAVDRLLCGLRPGRLYVIGARPKMGKTSMALALQHNAARAGNHVGFASAEMSAKECAQRWIAAAAGVDATSLQTGRITQSDQGRIQTARQSLSSLPIHILDKAGASPAHIRRQSLAWQRRYGLDLLVVDYLQRLSPDADSQRRDLTVGAMARAFKNVARDLDIPVVLLAQLSRDLENRPDKRPIPSDLRDSGEIEQEADVIAFLYRDWVYNENASPNDAEFLVRGNRQGPAGRATLHFEPSFQRWLDRDMVGYEDAA